MEVVELYREEIVKMKEYKVICKVAGKEVRQFIKLCFRKYVQIEIIFEEKVIVLVFINLDQEMR